MPDASTDEALRVIRNTNKQREDKIRIETAAEFRARHMDNVTTTEDPMVVGAAFVNALAQIYAEQQVTQFRLDDMSRRLDHLIAMNSRI